MNDSYSVTVPAAVRREAGLEAGDKIRWSIDEDGTLSVQVVKQQYGAFSELEPVDVGEPTDAASGHDFLAGDYWWGGWLSMRTSSPTHVSPGTRTTTVAGQSRTLSTRDDCRQQSC